MAGVESVSRRRAEAEGKRSSDEAEIDSLLRRFFEREAGDGSDAAPTPQFARPRRDVDMAFELLDRASQAFDVLVDRCRRFEHDLDQANERIRAQAAEQAELTEQWRRLASGLKARLDAGEAAAAALKARCEGAEDRAARAERKLEALERASARAAGYAARAEDLSTKLHDKVVSAFGIGSRAHRVLEAVATRAAAE